MTVKLIDSFAGCGGIKSGDDFMVTAEMLAAEMKKLDIAKAIVRMEPADLDISLSFSTRELYKLCNGRDSFIPCPLVVPAICDDVPSEKKQLEEALANFAGGVEIRPKKYSWRLEEWCSGKLFETIEKHSMPLFVRLGNIEYDELFTLAERYKGIPFVLLDVAYRHQRIVIPMLKKYSNIYVSLGEAFCPYHGIEQTVEKVGAGQLLFGTGFPNAEAMMGVTYLMYSKLSDDDKQLIGSGNIERLLGGIK